MRSADDFVAWFDELFTTLGLGADINLAGISYGGWIESQYALRHPQRLRKLVLLAPVITILPLSRGFIVRAMLCMIPHRSFARRFVYWLAADVVARDDTRRWVDAMSMTAISGCEASSGSSPSRRPCSAQDAVARLNKVAPRVATLIVAGAGHDLTAVQAEAVNAAILGFVTSSS